MTPYQPPPFRPQPPYPPYPQPGPYGPPAPPVNGVAIAGFVVAIVGLVISFVPFVGIVAWAICPVGLVLSIAGMTVATRRAGVGRSLAIAGIILSAIGLVICFLWAITFAAATNSSSYDGTTWSAPSSSAFPDPTA